jgi:Phage regulatory protein CII (CP76)
MHVMDAAYHVVHGYPGGAESLGPRVGKSATTLSHEVSRTGTAKLGLETAEHITVLSGDYRILEAFAARCGRFTLPLPEVLQEGGDCVLARLGDLLREQSHVVNEVTLAARDGVYTPNERKRITKEVGHLIATATQLVAALGPGSRSDAKAAKGGAR